jgi:hypothetical protein
MRFLLTLLMVFSVFAGLNARVLALDCGTGDDCCEPVESCCVEVHDTSVPEGNHHDGDGCPVEHHHHHHVCCSHGLLTAADGQSVIRLTPVACGSPQLRPEGDLLPDDPFLGSEKPPLI